MGILNDYSTEPIRCIPKETPERRFWRRVYLIALKGICDHDRWHGVEHFEAEKLADKSLEILMRKFGPIIEERSFDEPTTN